MSAVDELWDDPWQSGQLSTRSLGMQSSDLHSSQRPSGEVSRQQCGIVNGFLSAAVPGFHLVFSQASMLGLSEAIPQANLQLCPSRLVPAFGVQSLSSSEASAVSCVTAMSGELSAIVPLRHQACGRCAQETYSLSCQAHLVNGQLVYESGVIRSGINSVPAQMLVVSDGFEEYTQLMPQQIVVVTLSRRPGQKWGMQFERRDSGGYRIVKIISGGIAFWWNMALRELAPNYVMQDGDFVITMNGCEFDAVVFQHFANHVTSATLVICRDV